MNYNQAISKKLLFLPVCIFIFFNFFSAYYIIANNVYNGDFLGIPLKHSAFEVWLFALLSSIPYLLMFFIVLKTKSASQSPLKIPKLFITFAYFILIIALFLTIFFGVGMIATEIYSVPFFAKPFVVLINRVDPLTLSALLILSPYINWRAAILITFILFFIFILRGSLSALPVIFFIFFFRFFVLSNNESKKIRSFLIFSFFAILGIFIIFVAPKLYELRESVRGLETSTELNVYEFIFGKLIGRLSNLSALLMFDLRYDLFVEKIDDLQLFSYANDTLKYFWGSFIKYPIMNHYDFYTSIHDHFASGFYAMQTGVIPALIISSIKSPIIGIFDLLITLFCIFIVTKLCTFFLGDNGKYLAVTLLILPVLSGAPNQFSNPIYNLIVISIVFLITKHYALNSKLKI